MRRLLVVVALVVAGMATLLAAVGSARSPRPPGLIVFSDRAREGGNDNHELYSIRPDGSGRVQLTHRATFADNPDLAADRRHIVFCHFDDSQVLGEIQVTTIGGTDPTVVADYGEYPKWSPDGRSIAYQVPLEYGSGGRILNGLTDIWVVRPDVSEPRKLIDAGAVNWVSTDAAADQALDWSPDSSRIAFQAPGPNGITVNVVDLASGGVTRIGVGEEPNWSPHGDLIAFAQRRSILVARPDGSGLRRVTAVPKNVQLWGPSWSHDGRRLAFYAANYRRNEYWRYLVDSDGSHRVRVRPRAFYGGVGQARWSPDDRWLVFSDGLSLYRVRADGTSLVRLTSGSSPDWE